jgi:hypothetical protein
VTTQETKITTGIGFPQPNGLIGSGRSHEFAVRRKCDGEDIVRVTSQKPGGLFKGKPDGWQRDQTYYQQNDDRAPTVHDTVSH